MSNILINLWTKYMLYYMYKRLYILILAPTLSLYFFYLFSWTKHMTKNVDFNLQSEHPYKRKGLSKVDVCVCFCVYVRGHERVRVCLLVWAKMRSCEIEIAHSSVVKSLSASINIPPRYRSLPEKCSSFIFFYSFSCITWKQFLTIASGQNDTRFLFTEI